MEPWKDPYYALPQTSNSDLSWLKKKFMPYEKIVDLEQAYRFGTLIDCMITEPHKVDYFQLSCAGNKYSADEFKLAEAMKKSFYRDPLARMMAENSVYQKVSIRKGFEIEYDGLAFQLDVRCKWDLFAEPKLKVSGDIKSTTATTQKQFEEAVRYFDYDRQRAWYMDIEGTNKDLLIGISKKNCQVFKVPIGRGSELYESGKRKYQELAFRWWCLFGNDGNGSEQFQEEWQDSNLCNGG